MYNISVSLADSIATRSSIYHVYRRTFLQGKMLFGSAHETTRNLCLQRIVSAQIVQSEFKGMVTGLWHLTKYVLI